MAGEHWRTYTREQAQQVISGLQVLLDRNVLDEKEQEVARRIQRKLSYQEEETTLVPFGKEEDKLLNEVEMALWR